MYLVIEIFTLFCCVSSTLPASRSIAEDLAALRDQNERPV